MKATLWILACLGFLLPTLYGSAWAAAGPTQVGGLEKPHTLTEALDLSFPGHHQGEMGPSQRKQYFRFRLEGSQPVSVKASLTTEGVRNAILYLLDHTGAVINKSDFFKNGATEQLTSLMLPPGNYAVGILAKRKKKPETMPYSLRLSGIEGCPEEPVRKALNRALDYLVSKQLPEGGYKVQMGKVAIPGFVLQALLNAQCLERDDWQTIYGLVDFLKTHYQDPNTIAGDKVRALYGGAVSLRNRYGLYEHAIALTALIEARLSGIDEGLAQIIENAVAFTLRSQLTSDRPPELNGPIALDSPFAGGWRYRADAKDADLSVTGWQIISLVAARMAGITVPEERLALARDFVLGCYRDEMKSFAYMPNKGAVSTGRNAMGALSLLLLDSKDDAALTQALTVMRKQGPAWNGEPIGGGYPMYYWYYGTRAAYLVGGDFWEAWKPAVCGMLVRHQNPDGSWDPNQRENQKLDRLYTASLGALILEICCGSPPLYLHKNRAPQPKAPQRENMTVSILQPRPKDQVQGPVTIEAHPKLSQGLQLASVTYLLDKTIVAERTQAPWTVSVDTGAGVRARKFSVIARSTTGKEARSSVTTQAGQDRIRIKLIAPRQGVVHGLQKIVAETKAHPDSPVKKVTLAVDGKTIFEGSSAPFETTFDFGVTHGRTITAQVENVLGTLATHSIKTRKGQDRIQARIMAPRGGRIHGRQTIRVKVTDHPDSRLQDLYIFVDGRELLHTTKAPFEVDHTFSQAGGQVITARAVNVLGTVSEDSLTTQGLRPLEVNIDVTVLNQDRFHVKGLQKQDFAVFEDEVPQTITRFSSQTTPVSIALLLDVSGSMRRQIRDVQAAAGRFLAEAGSEDRIAVLTFADWVRKIANFTADIDRLNKAIRKTRAKGGTALYDAVLEGLQVLNKEKNRAAIVVLTDGKDEDNPGTGPGSRHTLGETLEALMGAKVAVYTLGLGKGAARAPLEQIAKASGGRAYFPPTVKDLVEVYTLVARELKNQYHIGFSSTNRQRDRAWRTLQVTTPDKPLTVQGPDGYRPR